MCLNIVYESAFPRVLDVPISVGDGPLCCTSHFHCKQGLAPALERTRVPLVRPAVPAMCLANYMTTAVTTGTRPQRKRKLLCP
jgi:hypothetical protein